LNRDAAEALHEIENSAPEGQQPIHAVTDVTGFGLLGHAREMAIGYKVSMTIDHARVEYLPGALEASRAKFFYGGMKNNRDFVESCTEFSTSVPDEFRALMFDPQTSGGLLVAVFPPFADAALAALGQHKVSARQIGYVRPHSSPLLAVV
jgi:selenide,water dikinase